MKERVVSIERGDWKRPNMGPQKTDLRLSHQNFRGCKRLCKRPHLMFYDFGERVNLGSEELKRVNLG